jgi:hypothetical protein
MPGQFFRFRKTEVEKLSMLKGENSWYAITDGENHPVWHCHVIGSGMGSVHWLTKPMLRDWCVELGEGGQERIDTRTVAASMILLLEQTIRMDLASVG